MNIQDLSELIRNRRSIYPPMYNNQEISKSDILSILENANWAPNHKKTEPWRFKIFQDESLIKLSTFLGEDYQLNTPSNLYSEKKYQKNIAKPLQSACVIAVCMYNDPDIALPEWEEIAAVACAVQNMWLSCTALGIGSYFSTPKSVQNMGKFLNLQENEKCLGLYYMGYSDIINLPSSRNPISEKITWL